MPIVTTSSALARRLRSSRRCSARGMRPSPVTAVRRVGAGAPQAVVRRLLALRRGDRGHGRGAWTGGR